MGKEEYHKVVVRLSSYPPRIILPRSLDRVIVVASFAWEVRHQVRYVSKSSRTQVPKYHISVHHQPIPDPATWLPDVEAL
jgi:hypothetical protein